MNMVREGQHSVLSQVKQSNQMLDKHMTQNICLLRSHSLCSHDSVCQQDGRISKEDKLKSRSSESLNIGLPALVNATANHKPSCHPASHMPPSCCVPPSSGVSSADCGSTANQSSCTGPHSTYLAQCSVSSDPLTCPIIAGCINTIDICKGSTGLGLSIVGGCNTLLVRN